VRRIVVCAAFVVLGAALAAPAQATVLDGAVVNAQTQRDGYVLVSEQITMSDVFHGGYRDIPLAGGQSIDRVSVSEKGHPYTYGGSTVLGSVGQPGTFATTHVGNDLRVVWHFDNPGGGPRTFTISYRFRGLAVAYDDVVDVNLNVWGSAWAEPLPSLRATLRLPKPTRSPLTGSGPGRPGCTARSRGRRRRPSCGPAAFRLTSSSTCALFSRARN
jgi:uncharacterized membrane protein